MKIAYVTKQLPFGFSEAFILPELAEHRAAPGWEVWLAPLSRGALVHGPALLEQSIVAPVCSPAILFAALAELLAHPLRTARLCLRMLQTRTPGLALRNLAVFPKGLWLGRRLKRAGFQHLHIHFAAVPATMGVVAAKVAGLPYSLTAHRYDIAQNNLLQWKARDARFLRAIDAAGADEICEHIGTHRGKLANLLVLHMGVPVPDRLAPHRGGPLAPFRLAIAARLVCKKGHRHLLEALAIARRHGQAVTLAIFGDGPLETVLRHQANELGIADAVVWHGATAHHTILSALQTGQFDAAVLPSITTRKGDKEGIPVFLIEAMAAGLPVITTLNGGIAELAGNGAGLIVPEGDASALAAAIIGLAQDGAERARLAEAGRARVQAAFEIASSMLRLRELMTGEA